MAALAVVVGLTISFLAALHVNYLYLNNDKNCKMYFLSHSLKASFEAINLGIQSHEFAIGRDLVGLSGSVGPDGILGAPSTPGGAQPQKRKKSHSRTPSATIVAPPPPLLVKINLKII